MSAFSLVTISPDLLFFKNIILRDHAIEVPTIDKEHLKLCQKLAIGMFEIMYANDGAALAAPQVGISLRLVVMDPAKLDFGPHVLINPVILSKSEIEIDGIEGCLSIPRYTGKIFRSVNVKVIAYNLKGESEEYNATDWLARIFQHEIDHLEGILYPDRLKEIDHLTEIDTIASDRAKRAINTLLDKKNDTN